MPLLQLTVSSNLAVFSLSPGNYFQAIFFISTLFQKKLSSIAQQNQAFQTNQKIFQKNSEKVLDFFRNFLYTTLNEVKIKMNLARAVRK